MGGVMAWGAPVVSVLVLVTFGGVVSLTLLRTLPPGSEAVLNVLLGTLGAMATNVVGYWVGSSAGSARKDERLAEATVERLALADEDVFVCLDSAVTDEQRVRLADRFNVKVI